MDAAGLVEEVGSLGDEVFGAGQAGMQVVLLRSIEAAMAPYVEARRGLVLFTALLLAFVAVAFSLSFVVGMKAIDENDVNVGEARTADHIVRDAGFPADEQSEVVIVQSETKTIDDPAFRAVVVQALGAVSGFEQVDRVESPLEPGNADLISKDRHAAMIPFRLAGDYVQAIAYIDEIVASRTRFTGVSAGSAWSSPFARGSARTWPATPAAAAQARSAAEYGFMRCSIAKQLPNAGT